MTLKISNKVNENFKPSYDTVTTDKNVISEKFNDFFVDIRKNLARKIHDVNTYSRQYLGERMIQSIFFQIVTTEEINKGSLKKGAPGYDKITVDALRLSLDILNETLCY